MKSSERWVFLVYRLPREPSAPRLAVWRKLKRLGVAQIHDGLVALPLDSRNREQLEWVAEEILESEGEAAVWLAEPTTAVDPSRLAEQLSVAISDQYNEVAREATQARTGSAAERRRALARLRRELGRIRRRDYFPPPERAEAEAAVAALANQVEAAAA